MNWAQRLKRIINIDAEIYDQYGGTVKAIACIEDAAVIRKILDHLDNRAAEAFTGRHQETRNSHA